MLLLKQLRLHTGGVVMKPGDRAGAAISMADGVVKLLGFGVYEGDFIPDEKATGAMAEVLRNQGVGNPKIRLDNNDIVWGCECWWGSEEKLKALIKGAKEVETIDIHEYRKAAGVPKYSPPEQSADSELDMPMDFTEEEDKPDGD